MKTLHLITQRDQPYGSVRQCCEMCGRMVAAIDGSTSNYTDSVKVYNNPPSTHIQCTEVNRVNTKNIPVVVAGIAVRDDRVLLIEAAHGCATPGGKVREGEAHEDALHRKFLQETGLNVIHVGRLMHIDRQPTFECHTYAVEVHHDTGELRPGGSVTRAWWGLPHEITNYQRDHRLVRDVMMRGIEQQPRDLEMIDRITDIILHSDTGYPRCDEKHPNGMGLCEAIEALVAEFKAMARSSGRKLGDGFTTTNLGDALSWLESGASITRKTWSDDPYFVTRYYSDHAGKREKVLLLMRANGNGSMWCPKHDDVTAEDWYRVERVGHNG